MLHGTDPAATVPIVGLESDDIVERLERIVIAMRRLGVVRFEGIELGPDPTAERPDDEDETQRSKTSERTKAERDQRLRFGASGGPRPAVAR